ncbi:fluoride efflux transporter CrcB [Williamsia herbipolensis]|uniref:fluoride efflux transporter CrcB n=1 Tax=Williamsia herbipolensis TaxID=1603258 RepID=UPI0005F85ED6|nr:fluoride efflux transporter CrcB [Williamsia herbipolensis]
MTLMLTIIAGAIGAVCRFVVDAEVKSRWKSTVPWATVGINVSGSLLLGVLAGAALFHGAAPGWQTVLGTGFCGGYTTFSTASFESVRLIQQRAHLAAAVNILGTLGASVAACALGLFLASAL